MSNDWPVWSLWLGTLMCFGVLVLLLLCASQPASLRFVQIGWMLFVGLIARGLLCFLGVPMTELTDGIAGMICGLLVVGCFCLRRWWLVRTTVAQFREQIETARRGLFLDICELQSGLLLLNASGQYRLRYFALSNRLLVLVLPHNPALGKVRLLLGWLGKTYPVPVPRIRIHLKGGLP